VTAWTTAGVEVQTVSAAEVGGGVQLTEVLDELGRRGVLQLMVEGGGAVHTSFLKQVGAHRTCLVARLDLLSTVLLGSHFLQLSNAPSFSFS
jgi:riboflavin biosynthesis pyrimidine reductase